MSDVHGRNAGVVNFANGAITETAKRAGANWAQNAQPGGMANKAGHKAVAAVAAVAAANPVGAAVVGVAAVGFGCYWLAKKIMED